MRLRKKNREGKKYIKGNGNKWMRERGRGKIVCVCVCV